jgi:hypothetical protein
MISAHKQFAIEHMGWTEGETEPTEQEIIEATAKHYADQNAARDKVIKKLGLTADEVATLLS